MKRVEMKEQMNPNAVYYSNEYIKEGCNFSSYTRLYDSSFEPIEDIEVVYTNALAGLIRIVKADRINDTSLQMYKLIKLNDDFYKIVKDEDTTIAMECIANTVKPKNWK